MIDIPEASRLIKDFLDNNTDVLLRKNNEYGITGIFHNFEAGAAMLNTTRQNALAGMMVKHTTSVYDMCRNPQEHSLEQWQEKIGDHINYLLLLYLMNIEDLRRAGNIPYNETER